MLLSKYQPPLQDEIPDRIEAVRCAFEKVVERIHRAMDEVLIVQTKHRETLRRETAKILEEINVFCQAFQTVG